MLGLLGDRAVAVGVFDWDWHLFSWSSWYELGMFAALRMMDI